MMAAFSSFFPFRHGTMSAHDMLNLILLSMQQRKAKLDYLHPSLHHRTL